MDLEDRRSLVLFGHGARDTRWADSLRHLQAELARRWPRLRVELAFLEFQSPDLAAAMEDLAHEGYAEIRVAPVFWSLGGHAARDLPAIVDAFRERFPQVTVTVLPVLSEIPGLIRFLADALNPASPLIP